MADADTIRFLLPGAERPREASREHGPHGRGGGADRPLWQADVTVRRHFEVRPAHRALDAEPIATPPLAPDDVLALEMEGGFVLYTSAGRLADDLRRIDPGAERDGALPLSVLQRRGPATRGLGDWVVRALSVLGIDDRAVAAKAAEKATEWGADVLLQGASRAGTKALMWAIEQQLERAPGLYAWGEDAAADGDLLAGRPAALEGIVPGTEMLVFVHGTGSSTAGSFGELRRPPAAREWLALRQRFGAHVYGFEHRTFSESPIENALALASALPPEARLSLVTHSRGGLVGDLLTADGFDAADAAFDRGDVLLAQADDDDRRAIRALAAVLAAKRLRVERYVRVACPAQGTLLASTHVDAFLSALLHLIGMVPALAGSPVYAVVKRIVLQIARNRTDPRLVPGIEAMLPESPLAALLGRTAPQPDARIAAVAGDVEGGGVLKRLGVFLSDYLLFEAKHNDLVVDTESMLGGVAREAGRYVFDQGDDVNHFRYFANARTRRALHEWLTADAPQASETFTPIRSREPLRVMHRGIGDVTGARPVVVFLPGIMGSHLRTEGERVWFDFLRLARGTLPAIAWGRPDVAPDGPVRLYYGDLLERLDRTHDVIPLAYDWRRSLEETARLLATELDAALERTAASGQPVRLMAHSMGGLVVRALVAGHPETWARLVARPGGRCVMLGTPNQGSHGTVESLLGLSGTVRKLAMLDRSLGVQGVVELIAGFPGALQLLPRPGFRDTGDARHDYYAEAFWIEWKQGNDSRWFGKNLGAVPAPDLLAAARASWERLPETLPDVDRFAYVAGYGYETPCGVERDDRLPRRLRMVGTLHGDGTVTHDSGLLDVLRRNQRVWFANADHAGLVDDEAHFDALAELLERGQCRLPQARPSVRGEEQLFRYEPGPVLHPTLPDLERTAIGGRRPPIRRPRARQTLSIGCRAMDLRHAVDPILVGHYEGDAIAGAEAQIDRSVVDGRLTLRHHLDAYAGPVGSVAVVVDEPPAEEDAGGGVRRGAIVVGLGAFGELTAATLLAAVRQGALRYLLQLHDRSAVRNPPKSVGLASLLLGYNSTTHISIEDSVSAVIRGVIEANRLFAEASGSPLRIDRLELIELFEDVAISAAKAVRDVATRLAREADRLGVRLEPATVLECGAGMRQRLEAAPTSFGYWPRLIVTEPEPEGTPPDGQASPAGGALRYVFLSMRARAEALVQQRQPGVVDELVENGVRLPRYQRNLARALFHLLVPHELKEAARQAESMVVVVDARTARLPWEMLVADDEPLIRTTAMVRQLASGRFRHVVRSAREHRAYVIGNPSTAGYYRAFPRAGATAPAAAAPGAPPDATAAEPDALPDLAAAAEEARTVADLLAAEGYQVTEAPPGAEGIDVLARLYERPYRILHIAAHGVFEMGTAGKQRTGVVLSGGLMLTAQEIGSLEAVPDLVFLNCCYVGRMGAAPATPFNRLAYGIARELIEMGVRAVIAAGWAVDDEAARTFAEHFYRGFVREHRTFGKAVYEARRATYDGFPESNTWGAFQAYGEPSFVMDPESLPPGGAEAVFAPVAPQELIARIELMRNELAHERGRGRRGGRALGQAVERLLRDSAGGAWPRQPGVLYALGRLYADAGDFERAREHYTQAIACEDAQGRVPVVAIEQLANMEVREGARRMEQDDDAAGKALVDRGLERLQGLARAAGGVGDVPGEPVSAERCALIGSAYKRLARALPEWIGEDAEPGGQPTGVRDALRLSRDWYRRGEGDPDRPDFSPYDAQNRIALSAVLGDATPADAELALRAGDVGAQRFERTRDYFDALMAADGLLIARLVDGTLAETTDVDAAAVEREIVGRYRSVSDKLPATARVQDSVVSQIRLLADFYESRAEADGDVVAATTATRLHRVASALAGEAPRLPAGDVAVAQPDTATTEKAAPSAAAAGARKLVEELRR